MTPQKFLEMDTPEQIEVLDSLDEAEIGIEEFFCDSGAGVVIIRALVEGR